MRLDSDDGSSQGERLVSNVPQHSHRSKWDCEIENPQKQVREFEIEIKGRHQRRDHDGLSSYLDYDIGSMAKSSHQTDSRRPRERSNETMGWHHVGIGVGTQAQPWTR